MGRSTTAHLLPRQLALGGGEHRQLALGGVDHDAVGAEPLVVTRQRPVAPGTATVLVDEPALPEVPGPLSALRLGNRLVITPDASAAGSARNA